MQKLIMIFAVLVMLGGATASALKWLQLGPFEGMQQDEKPKKEKAEKAALVIDMEPLVIPIFQENKVAALVQIEVKLEAMGEDKAAKVKYLLPLIIDAYIRDLHGFMPRMLKAKEKVDPEVLRERLLVIGARTAGKGLISNVVIGDIIEQPSR
jgi:flagellar basal body-associated protein FliL